MVEALLSRSRLVLLATAALLVAGLVSYQSLPRREDPELSFAGCTVLVPYPGALPEQVEDVVTVPLEKRILGLRGLKEVTSTSAYGRAVLALEFHENVDSEQLVQEVREVLEATRAEFPDEVETPELSRWKSQTVAFLLAVSGAHPWAQLEHYVRLLARELEVLDEVERVEIDGIPSRQMLVELDPARLLASGITVSDVIGSLGAAHIALPGGRMGVGRRDLVVSMPWRFEKPEEVADTGISVTGGGTVRLAEVASVRLAYADDCERVRLNGKHAAALNVWLTPDANPVVAGKRIREVLGRALLPSDLTVEVIHDQGGSVARRLDVFQGNLVVGALLVVLLTAVIMGARMALVVSVAVPVAVASALTLMAANGMSLDQISLASLVLVLGMLVDNAIVVVENAQRHLNMRKSRRRAVDQGTREVLGPIASSTLTTCIAFVPLLLMSGHTGEFIRGIPLTVMFAIGSSLLVAMTVSPVLSNRLLRAGRTTMGRESPLARTYGVLLQTALRRPGLVLAAAGAAALLSAAAIPRLGLQFFPKAEKDLLVVDIDCPPGTSLEGTESVARLVGQSIRETSGVRSTLTYVGWNGPHIYYNLNFMRSTSPWTAQLLVRTTSARVARELAGTLSGRLAAVAGADVRVSELEQGPPVGAPVSVSVKGDDLEVLDTVAERIEDVLARVPGVTGVHRSSRSRLPELHLTLDRGKAGRLGVPPSAAGTAVRVALAGASVADIQRDDGEVDLVVRFPEDIRNDPDLIRHLYVRSAHGTLVPLENLVETRLAGALDEIVREDGIRTVTVRSNVVGRLPGQVMDDAARVLASMAVPSGVLLEVGGETAERDESFASLGRVMAIAILLIYTVLVGQFDSFKQPLAVLLAIPLSIVGGVVGLALTGYPFGFMAFLGVVSLTGVVVNDSIVLVSHFNLLRGRGAAMRQAVTDGCRIRMRPVLLTTVTTIGGLLPLALRGGSLWGPMAWVVIFGLGGATVLTLVVVPCLYLLLERGRVTAETPE
jgi:multidrug efflux pump